MVTLSSTKGVFPRYAAFVSIMTKMLTHPFLNLIEISFSKSEYKDYNITLGLAKDISEPKTSVYYGWGCARVSGLSKQKK